MSELEEEVKVTSPVETDEKTSCNAQEESCKTKKKKCGCCICRWIVDIVLCIAVVVLYILHFCCPKETTYRPVDPGTPRSGEVVYINIDTINARYQMVDILTKDIDEEMAKQETIFQNRQAALERKAAQFQQNYQAGILTQVQVENAQAQLMQESQTLQADYERVTTELSNRQAAALKQITDSVIAATQKVNAARNASFVFSYQYAGQLIDADPSKDITNEVLELLNKPYKKK